MLTIIPSNGDSPDGIPLTIQPKTVAAPDVSSLVFEVMDDFHGIAHPSEQANLPSLVRGTISVIHVQEGQAVSKGTPLITLDNRVPKARLVAATVNANLTGALRRAEVDFKMAQSRLNRLRMVVHRGAGASFELEEAEGVRDQASAALEQQRDILKAAEAERQLAEAQLDQFTISAPFDGVVTEIHQKSGAVDPSLPLVSVANLKTLEIEMHLPSRLIGHVQTGETIQLKAEAPVTELLNASVVSVSPIINSASNTFRCLLQVTNTELQMPAGFSVVLNDHLSGDVRGEHSASAGISSTGVRR